SAVSPGNAGNSGGDLRWGEWCRDQKVQHVRHGAIELRCNEMRGCHGLVEDDALGVGWEDGHSSTPICLAWLSRVRCTFTTSHTPLISCLASSAMARAASTVIVPARTRSSSLARPRTTHSRSNRSLRGEASDWANTAIL